MSKVCQITGKRPMTGNNVSHAKTTKTLYQIYIDIGFGSKGKFVSLQVSTKGMRIIDKKGIETVEVSFDAKDITLLLLDKH